MPVCAPGGRRSSKAHILRESPEPTARLHTLGLVRLDEESKVVSSNTSFMEPFIDYKSAFHFEPFFRSLVHLATIEVIAAALPQQAAIAHVSRV